VTCIRGWRSLGRNIGYEKERKENKRIKYSPSFVFFSSLVTGRQPST
jgi:hypothetical protein